MCPLRIILIFLSATVAGFFVLKNFKSQPKPDQNENDDVDSPYNPPTESSPSSKVSEAIGRGFCTCVDMASGRYLWRTLVSSSSSSKRFH